jgi:sRNA-binding regulator protein Hfq
VKNFASPSSSIAMARIYMIFKHAIATIRSPRSISNYYSTHEG